MDWMAFRKIYFAISGSLIILSVFGLVRWGLRLGVDFKGGSIIEYKFDGPISTEEATNEVEKQGIGVTSIQSTGEYTFLFRLPPISEEDKLKVESAIREFYQGGFNELRFETVGPSIGPELIKKTLYALIIAAGAILIWVAYQFKNFKYGLSAILAMFHDTFILVGLFSLLGHFMQVEVDFLFVTAALTTLSFSVHDTIVVYDRIRERKEKEGGEIYNLANQAITETMVRSLNNSFTILFMLLALILMGGTTIKWFAIALFIGTILGTYSSPFVAVPLLVSWDEIQSRLQERRKK